MRVTQHVQVLEEIIPEAYFKKIAGRHLVTSFIASFSRDRISRADGVVSFQLLSLSAASANVNTLNPKQESTSYGRVGSELMYSTLHLDAGSMNSSAMSLVCKRAGQSRMVCAKASNCWSTDLASPFSVE